MPALLRKLGARDAALIVMGGIIGSGIFKNPSSVARYVHTAPLIMLAWSLGGVVALLGAGIFAELAARRPRDGGLYAYMRDAFHPAVAFMYGWTLLLVSQSGGAAASAVVFSAYVAPYAHVAPQLLAVVVIGIFTAVNCLGVRQGASTQNGFMLVKIGAILLLVAVGVAAARVAHATVPAIPPDSPLVALGVAMVPVLFAYSGWQTSSFMSAELREPRKTLPRGMIAGVLGVVILYLGVNAVCVLGLGETALAATSTPAADLARIVFGAPGAIAITVVVALSTLGFISNQILTSPRIYFQMAADGLFFKQLAWVDPRTHVPVVAIALQGIVATIIAVSGQYDAILNYVTSVDYVFFGLSAIALFVFRARDTEAERSERLTFRMPLHPWSTALFLIVAWSIVGDVLVKSPRDTSIGLGILLSGLPVYFLFARKTRPA